MKGLKYGAAAGHDGISTEYLWFAVNTKLPLYLSHLLTVCLQFGEVPDAFRAGVLVPILKGLKYGAAAGHDGITTEYLRFAVNTKLSLYLSHWGQLCVYSKSQMHFELEF